MIAKILTNELANTYDKKYTKSYASNRIKNISGVTEEEFINDITTIYKDIKIKKIVHTRQDNGLSDTFPTIIYDDNEKICLCGKTVKNTTGSDTIFKECMVCYFYSSKLTFRGHIKDFKQFISKIIDDITLNSIQGISKLDRTIVLKTLNQYVNLNDEDLSHRLKNILNPLSIANKLIDLKYKDNGWIVLRENLFNDMKKCGSKLTGLKPDKYNPMDIMLIRPNTEYSLYHKINNISNIQQINKSYVCDIFNPDATEDVLAISLKEENSQFGKGKGYLGILKDKYTLGDYNLCSHEINLLEENYKSEIITYRQNALCKLYNIEGYNYEFESSSETYNNSKQFNVDKCKALHLINYILDAQSYTSDNIIIDILKFSLSMGSNPTFFKIQGSNKGNITNENIVKFKEGGDTIKLIGKINIIDSTDKNKGIKLKFDILQEDIKKSVCMLVRCNGADAKNAAIEVQSIK